MDAKTIIKRVATMCLDAAQDWCKDQFVLEFLEQIYEDAYNELQDINWPFEQQITEFLAVAANTADLSTEQVAGQPLEFMVTPVAMEWKLAGAPDTDYQPVDGPVDKLDDVANIQGILQWQFRNMLIYLTPSIVDVDVRLTWESLFPVLTDIDKVIALNSITNFLAYRCTALIQDSREKEKLSMRFDARGDRQLALIDSMLSKSMQGETRRFGSTTSLRRLGTNVRYPKLRTQ